MRMMLSTRTLGVGLLGLGLLFLGIVKIVAEDSADRTNPSPSSYHALPPVPGLLDGYRMAYDPFKPSDGPYPALAKGEKTWIDVSIDQQLVYIFHGSRRLYTMITSSGMEWRKGDESPLGVYHIQRKRGLWFYAPRYGEGAEYWVSWLGNGIYLFHSVPMNIERRVIARVAARLGHEASHGCFHLTIPDAKWFYEHIPYKSTLIVERKPMYIQDDRIVHPSRDQEQAILATETGR